MGQRRERPQPLASRLTDEIRAAHDAFVATLGDGAVWKKYLTS
jgi:DNA polymerase-3 subunit epsilon